MPTVRGNFGQPREKYFWHFIIHGISLLVHSSFRYEGGIHGIKWNSNDVSVQNKEKLSTGCKTITIMGFMKKTGDFPNVQLLPPFIGAGARGAEGCSPQVDTKSCFSRKKLHIFGNILLFFCQIISFRDGNTLWFKINNKISNYNNERSARSILSSHPSLDSQSVRNSVESSVKMKTCIFHCLDF